jgi:hypothetical protein
MLLVMLLLGAAQDAPPPPNAVAPPQPVVSVHSIGVLKVSAKDELLSCEDKSIGPVPEQIGAVCETMGKDLRPEFFQRIGGSGQARTIVLEIAMTIAGDPAPSLFLVRAGQIPSTRTQVRFDIAENGVVENCRDEETGEENWTRNLASPCSWGFGPFVPPVDPAGTPRTVAATLVFAVSRGP